MIRDRLKENKHIVKLYESVFKPIHGVEYKITHIELPSTEKTHFSYGKLNKDKKFYVIKYGRPECGIFSMVFHLMPQIEYALRRRYIPIIDCKETYLPMIQDKENEGKENPWEYYFEQPGGNYSLEEVYQSKHVIYVRKKAWGIKGSLSYNDFPLPDQYLHYWSRIFNRYLKPNVTLKRRIKNEKARFPRDGRILGISIRAEYRWGGLLRHSLYYQHPKVPDCNTFIEKITKMMDEWGYGSIFLACDDREYSDRIAGHFGDKCIRMSRPLHRFFEHDLPIASWDDTTCEFSEYTTREKTEDYIVETYLLAQCDSLYTCIGTGAQFAYVINSGRYKFMEVSNDGLWTKEDLDICD